MAAAEPDNFFKQKRTTSEIKDKILPAYFESWCHIHLQASGSQTLNNLLYLDVNAGEGYTPDGQPAAPVVILENIYQSIGSEEELTKIVKTCFVNPTEGSTNKLKVNLEQLPFYPELPAEPMVVNEAAFKEYLPNAEYSKQPTLIFLDPTKQGLNQQLLIKSLESTATDVLMVFNYNKVRQALLSEKGDRWEPTFWGSRQPEIKQYFLTQSSPKRRESYFMQAFEEFFQNKGFYTFKFIISQLGKNPVSQYLFLITKTLRGYLGIKDMMQAYSEFQEDGVPLFEATNKPQSPLLPGFFKYLSTYCLENLVEELAQNRSRFHYKTLQAIYEEHSIGTNYIKANYKTALEKLNAQGLLYPVNAQNKKVKAITDTSVIFYNLHNAKNK